MNKRFPIFSFFKTGLFLLPILLICPWSHALDAPLDYGPSIPHSSHISMMITDYRSQQIPIEYSWTVAHYDRVMCGRIGEYRRRNPAMKYYQYALNLTVIRETHATRPDIYTVYYRDMQKWYSLHSGFNLEDAFLHDAAACPVPGPKTEACRIQVVFGEHTRWVVNPGDAGLRAYNADRVLRIIANVEGSGDTADGIFFDEQDPGTFTNWQSFSVREYRFSNRYGDDVVDLLASERKAVGKAIMINIAESIVPLAQRMVFAAGAAQMELVNNPLSNEIRERWAFIESLLRQGSFVEMVSAYNWVEAKALKAYTPGNETTSLWRLKMAELCSYYMVVPRPATNLALDMTGSGWNESFSWQWLKAVEADVGGPMGPHTLFYEGADPRGKLLQVWRREFDRAVVFMRSKKPWDYEDYGDGTAISFDLPSGETWYPLKGDGTLGAPIKSLKLRNAEGAILFKGSTLTAAKP